MERKLAEFALENGLKVVGYAEAAASENGGYVETFSGEHLYAHRFGEGHSEEWKRLRIGRSEIVGYVIFPARTPEELEARRLENELDSLLRAALRLQRDVKNWGDDARFSYRAEHAAAVAALETFASKHPHVTACDDTAARWAEVAR